MKLDFLKEKYNAEISLNDNTETAIIFNPNTENNIYVYYSFDVVDYYTVCFCTQRYQIENEDDVIEYINSYLSGEILAIEFFINQQCSFGRNIKATSLNGLTAESLANLFGYSAKTILNKEFKIRGWFGNYDLNGKVIEKKGNIDLVMNLTNEDLKKTRFRDIVSYEKSVMTPIRHKVDYCITPIYLSICGLIIAVSAIFMSIDEDKYTPLFIALLCIFALLSIIMLISVPFTRKKEIMYDIKQYDFDTSKIADSEIYDFSFSGDSLIFDKYGMKVNGDFFWYNHLQIFINSKCYLHRIIVSIVFSIDEDSYCEIPLNGKSIKMIGQFDIPLKNPETLDYILNDTFHAFEKIYKKGKL